MSGPPNRVLETNSTLLKANMTSVEAEMHKRTVLAHKPPSLPVQQAPLGPYSSQKQWQSNCFRTSDCRNRDPSSYQADTPIEAEERDISLTERLERQPLYALEEALAKAPTSTGEPVIEQYVRMVPVFTQGCFGSSHPSSPLGFKHAHHAAAALLLKLFPRLCFLASLL